MNEPEKYELADYQCLRSETDKRFFLIRLGIDIHNLLIDVVKELSNGDRRSVGLGKVQMGGSVPPDHQEIPLGLGRLPSGGLRGTPEIKRGPGRPSKT